MEVKEFVDFCNERGVNTSQEELEYYEEQDILYPAFRIKLKRLKEIEDAWCKSCDIIFKSTKIDWRANPWDETCPKCKGHNIGYIIGREKLRPSHLVGKETFTFEEAIEDRQRQGFNLYEPANISSNPYQRVHYEQAGFWKTASEALQYYEKEGQLIHPSEENFRPWEDYYDWFIIEKGRKIKLEAFKTYYGYYQIHQLKWMERWPQVNVRFTGRAIEALRRGEISPEFKKWIEWRDVKSTIREKAEEIESIFKPLIEAREEIRWAYYEKLPKETPKKEELDEELLSEIKKRILANPNYKNAPYFQKITLDQWNSDEIQKLLEKTWKEINRESRMAVYKPLMWVIKQIVDRYKISDEDAEKWREHLFWDRYWLVNREPCYYILGRELKEDIEFLSLFVESLGKKPIYLDKIAKSDICKICQKFFIPKSKNQVLCRNSDCRKEYKRMERRKKYALTNGNLKIR